MKKNYQVPSMKKMANHENIMQMVATSNGYEQEVPGQNGTDDDARTPLF